MPSIDFVSTIFVTGAMCQARACTQTTAPHFSTRTPSPVAWKRMISCVRKFSPNGASWASVCIKTTASSSLALIRNVVVTLEVSGMATRRATALGTSFGSGITYRRPQTDVPGIRGSSCHSFLVKSEAPENALKNSSKKQASSSWKALTTASIETPGRSALHSGASSGASAAGRAAAFAAREGYLGRGPLAALSPCALRKSPGNCM
mmetsp:Transcript_36879/g.111474  ORF Transcript_36879/g.111474 Transcript_36879/m.111474 type:complete len:206 (+) Transcript_36879:159-776(+)